MSGVTGIVLAAGPSTRFGGAVAKQLVRFDGEPLVRRVARTALASRLDRILVVVGHESTTVSAVLAGLAVELVDNPRYDEGQSTSVVAGLSRVEERTRGAMFLPVDQPYLTAGLIDRLIERFEATGGPVVVPVYRGQRRAPVLFSRRLFAPLMRIRGDEGGRQLFSTLDAEEIVACEVADAREIEDLDTSDDLQRLRL